MKKIKTNTIYRCAIITFIVFLLIMAVLMPFPFIGMVYHKLFNIIG